MGLVLWYSLNGDLTDASGNDYDGSTGGSVTWVNGMSGQAIDTDATGVISLPTPQRVREIPTDDFTISLRMREYGTDTMTYRWNDHLNWTDPIVTRRIERSGLTNTSTSDYWCNFGFYGHNQDGPYQVNNDQIPVPIGDWFTLTIRKKGTTISAYVNGELDRVQEDTHTNADSVPPMNDGTLKLSPQASGTELDNLRFFDHALSEREIRRLHLGKIGHWPLNGTLTDVSGYDNHGTGTDISAAADTPIGSKSASFNGDTSSVDTGTAPNFDVLDQLTIAFWAKWDGDAVDQFPRIVSRDRSQYDLWLGSSGNNISLDLGQGTDDGSNQANFSAMPFDDNQWHHCAVTYNGSESPSLTCYIDGAEDSTNDSFSGAIPRTSNPLMIGDSPAIDRSWNGNLTDVRIYSRELSESDVKRLYENRAAIDTEGNVTTRELIELPIRNANRTQTYVTNQNWINVASYTDGNTIYRNGSQHTTLNQYEWAGISVSPGDVISADGPYTHGNKSYGTIDNWLGTHFAFRIDRSNPYDVWVASPYFDSDVTFTDMLGGTDTELLSTSIAAGGAANVTVDATLGSDTTGTAHVEMTATEPVALFVQATNGNDQRAVPPVDTELWGIASGSSDTILVEDGTEITAYGSDGQVNTGSGSRGDNFVGASSGSQYGPPAWRIEASGPISTKANADGDGVEATKFVPKSLMSTHFAFADDIEWITFIGTDPETTYEFYDETGTLSQTFTSSHNPHQYANGISYCKVAYGDLTATATSSQIPAGWHVECSTPQHAIVEHLPTNGETVILGYTPSGAPYGEPMRVDAQGKMTATSFDETTLSDPTTRAKDTKAAFQSNGYFSELE